MPPSVKIMNSIPISKTTGNTVKQPITMLKSNIYLEEKHTLRTQILRINEQNAHLFCLRFPTLQQRNKNEQCKYLYNSVFVCPRFPTPQREHF